MMSTLSTEGKLILAVTNSLQSNSQGKNENCSQFPNESISIVLASLSP